MLCASVISKRLMSPSYISLMEKILFLNMTASINRSLISKLFPMLNNDK